MTQIVQLCCAHCGAGINVAEPFRKLNTVPIACVVCLQLNELNYDESDEGTFYFTLPGRF